MPETNHIPTANLEEKELEKKLKIIEENIEIYEQ
jgi:hypothetical protein